MKEIDCSKFWLPQLYSLLDLGSGPQDQCIVCVERGALVAGMVYNMFNMRTVAIHIYIGSKPSKEWWWAVFDYPFNQLGLYKTICQIRSDNHKSMRLAENMGAVLEGRIEGFFPNSDLMIYTIVKADCKVLTSELWKRAEKWAA